ncbi:MAG TPA: ABC transporter substrate-binding protein, partial [Roseiflexaceae bacterium]|nr:ABC transporter substrate-binding protein [Roseiflexaceae bacterium]
MPRPTLLARTLALFVALGMLLAACGGAAPATTGGAATSAPAAAEPTAAAPAAAEPTAAPAAAEPTTAAAEPAADVSREDTLIFGADLTDQISMDPAVVYEFGGIQVVGSVYQSLVKTDPGDPTIKPLLAKSWEVKEDADGSTITFKLDETAKFASGAPVTADDVVYSWGRIVDLNKSPAFLFTDFGVTKDSFKAVDPQTVE